MTKLFTLTTLISLSIVTIGNAFDNAVTLRDIDLTNTRVYRAGKTVDFDPRGLAAALGIPTKQSRQAFTPAWIAGEPDADPHQTTNVYYILAFKRAITVGTVLVHNASHLLLPVSSSAVSSTPSKDGWREVDANARTGGEVSVFTLPPSTKTNAIMIVQQHRGRNSPKIDFIRLFGNRYANSTPAAVANAEGEYIRSNPLGPPTIFGIANISKGRGQWISIGPERDGERINRPPITDLDPSWFTLSWDQPRSISGLYIEGNVDTFELRYFAGPEGLNPAVGTKREWRKIREFSNHSIQTNARDFVGTFVSFPKPVTSRGLKLVINGVTSAMTKSQASMKALHAYSNLGTHPLPTFEADTKLPPFKFDIDSQAGGQFTLVVNDETGRRVRNVVARSERDAGSELQHWDLKNSAGRYVAPGKYQWKAVVSPGIALRYQMTPYPNVRENADNSPWLNGTSDAGGWLADHTANKAVCTLGDRVYIGAPTAESGVALLEADLTGRKLWGHHNFAAWTGPSYLAATGGSVFIGSPGNRNKVETVWKLDAQTKQVTTFFEQPSTSIRRRGMKGLAAHDGKLYVSVGAPAEWLENAASDDDVDISQCTPAFPSRMTIDNYAPDPRVDFLRLFRLTGTPPGQREGLTYLRSTDMPAQRQHLVLPFRREVSIGSLVFPFPNEVVFSPSKGLGHGTIVDDMGLRISVLKPGVTGRPDPNRDRDWMEIYYGKASEAARWMVVAAPANLKARAIRFTFDRAEDDLAGLTAGADFGDDALLGGSTTPWMARLDGMKILRRRYEGLAAKAKIRVNSGRVNKIGEWDARRDRPITQSDPGIYVMEWTQPQSVRGVAIKEIDGKRTEIDVYEGDAGSAIDIQSSSNWRTVGEYEQQLRSYYHPATTHNPQSRYMDGYVDFGQSIKTRAIRLRVVEQWTTRASGRAGVVGVRDDRGEREIDATRCRIYGVNPVSYLGGEIPVEASVFERIERYDIATGELDKEVPATSARKIAVNPVDGRLYGVVGDRVVRIDFNNGNHEPLTDDVQSPRGLTFDRHGNLYIFDAGPRNVRVYDRSGKYQRSIGTPGGYQPGNWDPTRFTVGPHIDVDLAIDSKDQLWVVEHQKSPKRTSLWTISGEFKKEFLGNTSYGGGGVLDPNDKTRLFYSTHAYRGGATLEFKLDWETGRTKLHRMPWIGDTRGGELPIQIEDRTYLVTRPQFGRQNCGIVYLYQDGKARLVAALGLADQFPPLRTPQMEASLKGQTLADMQFIWSDLNGDQTAQPNEVQFKPRTIKSIHWFDRNLGVQGGRTRYTVKAYLANGVPVYVDSQLPASMPDSIGMQLPDGNHFFFQSDRHDSANVVYSPTGERLWDYRTEGYGVHALYSSTPFRPDQVVSEFDVVGIGSSNQTGGGDFIVTNCNTGTWHVYTSDGLLIGRLFKDQRDGSGTGRRSWRMPEHQRGLSLDDVTCGQEHFQGYFTKSEVDGKYYMVAGHNHISVVEVEGLDRIQRLSGSIQVTADDIRQAQLWEHDREARETYKRALLAHVRPRSNSITIDGSSDDWSGAPTASLSSEGERDPVQFRMTHDKANLYLCYEVRGHGPMKNTGNDWRRLFKTGAAVDLQMSTIASPKMDPNRKKPTEGDIRLLLTVVGNEPHAVLYRSVDPSAPDSLRWNTHTSVFGVSFDRVERLTGIRMVHVPTDQGYVVEASIPLKKLGLNITEQLRLKLDWGLLVTDGTGSKVLQRMYWANKSTQIVSDEAAEAMLHPRLWGHVLFSSKGGSGSEAVLPTLDINEGPKDTDLDNLLDDLDDL